MSSQSLEAAIGILRILTTGIQNLAALIPILSSELCAKHVPKALHNGILYAAAAPMTIFGSLGIAKAGFIALCASIDHRFFHGPTLLKNAGFRPSGMGKRFLHVKNKKQHLYKAEDRLRTILNKKKVTKVKVNLWSWDFWSWNIKLALITAALSCLGLIPYIIFIQIFLVERTFLSTWVFPLARLFGSGLVVVNVQFLYQLRLIEEAYYRLRFIAADNYLKQLGKSLPTKWDPNERSKNIFTDLASEWLPLNEEASERSNHSDSRYRLDEADKERILDGAATLTSFDFTVDADALPPATTPKPSPRDTLQPTTIAATPSQSHEDTLHPTPHPTTPKSSVQDTLHRRGSSASRHDTKDFIAAEQGASLHDYPPGTPRVDTTASTRSRITTKARVIRWIRGQFTTLILWGTQVFLLVGILLTIIGYIGCATVVGSSPSLKWKGPLVWLACEAVLSGLRTLIWASNPDWDDARLPIVLEKSNGGRKSNSSQTDGSHAPASNSSSYGIGWALKSPTADDMHALIIGVNNCNTTDFEDLDKAKSDAESVVTYLRDTLLVPPSQIRTLYDTDATRSRIVEELKSLRHRGSVTPDAPIVIYYAGHSFVAHESTYLVPHLPNGDKLLRGEPKDYCLPYAEIVDLLRHVADEKTDNIVVILDSCHAGALGHRFESQPNSPKGLTSKRPSKSKHPKMNGLPGPSAEKPTEGLQLHQGSGLLPSISRMSDDGGGTSTTLAGLPPSDGRENEELDKLDSELLRVKGNDTHDRGRRKRPRKVTNATTEILIGHSSHLLLAGADASQQAYEDPVSGGRFTQTLLEVLRDAGKEGGDLQTMTYKMLVERIQERFAKIEAEPTTGRSLLDFQTALCTTIYQDRHLFDGLFRRKVDNRSAKPVMRVLYSD